VTHQPSETGVTRLWIVLGLALAATVAAPLGARVDPQTVTEGLRVFEDATFRGRSASITRDISNLASVGMNDQISSLRVAPGERWEVCEHASYRGRCELVSGNEPDLSRNGFDNIISSVRRRGSSDTGAAPGFGPSRGVYLFAGTRWTGERVAIASATTNLERNGFNDRANSIQVARGEIWEVCEHSNYGGRCVEVTEDVTDLDRVGMSRIVSSLRRRNAGDGGGFGGSSRERVILYSNANFSGRSLAITDSRTSLGDFRDAAQSLDVVSGRWEVCDQEVYRGNCREVTGGVRDLRTIGMNNRIQSVRRK